MRIQIRIAESSTEIVGCQRLMAETYGGAYGVTFSNDVYDLDEKIEPWPHRYLMGFDGHDLVAASGLYTDQTYVQRFGDVSLHEIQDLLDAAGAGDRYSATRIREVTKLVIRPDHRGTGLGRFFLAATHARVFVQAGALDPCIVVSCAKRSIWCALYRVAGLNTRVIKPFPLYRAHERYRSPTDPMDSRLLVPDLDIPARWYDLQLPGEFDLATYATRAPAVA